MMVTGLCGWLVSETATDFLANLPWFARLAFLVMGGGGAVFLLAWFGIRPWQRRLGDEAVALMIERALPAFRSRFIATVQLAKTPDGGASPTLVKALVAETTAMAAAMDFSAVVDQRLMRRWLKIAASSLVVVAALGALGGDKTAPLVRRALLSRHPVPRKTVIREINAPRVIAIGDPWPIAAVVGGIVPQEGRLTVKSASGRRQEFVLTRDAAATRPTFTRALQSIQEPFEYRLELGDAETDPVQVKVKPRPGVVSVECRQIFPVYTHLPPQRRALGDLKVLAGSRLALKAHTTATMKSGAIRVVGADHEKVIESAPLAVDPADRTKLSGEVAIPAKDAAGLTLYFVDEDGIESRAAAIYPLVVLADEPPTIKILWPDRREELLTREATMLIAFEAKDDYGVARLRLNYAVDWVEGGPYKTIDLDIGSDLPKEVNRRFKWRVGQITPHVEEGSVIDYWFEVLDGNDFNGPGIGKTEHMQARIVSETEKRADLANRLSDTMEGLNGVKQGQERVNGQMGEIIFEKPAGKP